MTIQKSALVIGGNGLLGYGTTKCLYTRGWKVKSLDRVKLENGQAVKGVDYVVGDLFDVETLHNALTDADTVFYFMSSTIPKSNDDFLNDEIDKTLHTLDYVLQEMVKQNVRQFIFPSSGGAVYGNLNDGVAVEDAILVPKTSYGMGKMLSEQILSYYHTKHGLNSAVLRIGNVYGSPLYRNRQQGVIDVFIQKALEGTPVTIWGNAEDVVRDYIFLDDVADAIEAVAEENKDGVQVFNVGSGVGITLHEVISCINTLLDCPMQVTYDNSIKNEVERIVLCIDKIRKNTGWKPKHDLSSGIKETFRRKKELLGSNG